MELRCLMLLPAVLACASVTPKRLVIPEEMRRPLSTGQSVREAHAAEAARTADGSSSIEVYRVRGAGSPGVDGMTTTDDLSHPKAPAPAPAVVTPKTGAAAPTLAGATAASAPRTNPPPQRLASPAIPTDAAQRYTLRLVEHGRVWEVELPESTGGYELHIPLGPGIEPPTEADQEMLGKTPPAGRSKSYLATLAKVGEMYANHRFELALIEVVDLEQQYPKDARLLAMKGSLYQKLGKTALAREAWKKSLELDPSDTTVAEALRALKEE